MISSCKQRGKLLSSKSHSTSIHPWPYLAWLGYDVQSLDTLSRHEHLTTDPARRIERKGGVRSITQALKESRLLSVSSWGDKGCGLEFGSGAETQPVLRHTPRAGSPYDWSEGGAVLLSLVGILW